VATSFFSRRNTTRRLFSSSSSSSSARSAGCSSSVTSRSLTYCFFTSILSRRLLVSISGSALTSSSRASSFSASRMSCFRSSVASSFRSLTSFWRTSSGISAGSSCTGRAASVSSFFFSSISILRTSYRIPAVGTGQNKKRRQRPASTLCQGFHAHKAAPFLPAEKCPNSTSYRAKKANAACSMSRPIAPKPHLRL